MTSKQRRTWEAVEIFHRFATDVYTPHTVFEVWARVERLGDAFVPAVIEAMQSDDDDIAMLACQVVAQHIEMTKDWKERGLTDSIPKVATLLNRPGTRNSAFHTLAAFGREAKSAIPALFTLFEDADLATKVTSADTILAIDIEQRHKLLPFLREVLNAEEEIPLLHHAAIDALGRLGHLGLEVVPVLVKLLDGENDCEASLAIWRITGDDVPARMVAERYLASDDSLEQGVAEEHLDELERLIDCRDSDHEEIARRLRRRKSHRWAVRQEGRVSVELGRINATVLFKLLDRLANAELNDAEKTALQALSTELEAELAKPFDPNFSRVLKDDIGEYRDLG